MDQWYPDPTARAPWRLARGGAWTEWLSDGVRSWADPRPVRRPLTAADADALRLVADVFLPEARAAGVLSPDREPGFRAVLETLRVEAFAPPRAPVAAPPAAPVAAPVPVPTAVPVAVPVPAPPAVPVAVPTAVPTAVQDVVPSQGPPPGPGLAASPPAPWQPESSWQRFTRAIGASLATHGLAYLGVLLLFVGVFGLVAFAFGDVAPSLRPVAELASAAVPFLAAWWLLRHGAAVVGRALEVLGGLLLPLLLITSLVDGFGFPPDPKGGALVVATTAAALACAAGYTLWNRWRPDSALGYAVVPALVLAAAMATLGVGRELPSGQDVAVPTAVQAGAMALVLAIAVLALRGRREARSGPATLVVVAVLALLTWASGDPVGPLVAGTGAALVVALLALRPLLPPALVDVAAPLTWGVTTMAIVAGPGVAAVVGVAGFLALAEVAGARRSGWAVVLPVAGLGAALLGTFASAAVAAAAFGAVGVWGAVRRSRPFPGTQGVFGVVTAVAPVVALAALGSAARPTIMLGAAAVLLVVALPAARVDPYWLRWWQVGVLLVAQAIVPVHAWALSEPGERWVGVAVMAGLAGLVGVGPLPQIVRVWGVTGLLTTAWLTSAGLAGMPAWVRVGGLAVVALAAVAWRRPPVVALAGHAVAAVAVLVSGGAWPATAALIAATAGWVLTAGRAERQGRVPGLPGARASWVIAFVGVTVSLLAAGHASALVPLGSTWTAAVPAAWAVALAAATRWLPSEARVVAPWVAGALAVVAVTLTSEPWPAALAFAAIAAVPLLVPAPPQAVAWAGWLALPPLALFTSLAVTDLPPPEVTSVSWAAVGAALALAVAATERGRWWPTRIGARPPAVVGAGALTVAGMIALGLPDVGGYVLGGIAVVVAALAVLTRTAPLAGGAVVIAWLAVLRAWPDVVADHPLVAVGGTVVALGLAEGAHRAHRARLPGWVGWDRSLMIGAGVIALSGLGLAGDGNPWVWVLTGAVAVGVAIVLARRGWPVTAEVLAGVGAATVVVGAAWQGAGYLALALLVIAVGHTGLALRGSRVRAVVGASAGAAAWLVAVAEFAATGQQAAEWSVLAGAGAAALAAGAALVVARVPRPVSISWWVAGLGIAAAGLSLPAVALEAVASWPLTVGLVGAALALVLGAFAFGLGLARDAAGAVVVAAVVTALAAGYVAADARVAVLASLAVAAAIGAVVPAVRRPAATASGAALLAAAWFAVAEPLTLAAVPAVLAVQAGVAGTVARNLALRTLSPVLACVAWLVAAPHLVAGAAWYTVPVGLALIIVAALIRQDRRVTGRDESAGIEAATELIGVAFLVGAFVVRAVTESVAWAGVVIALAVAVTGWGVATRVRRRVVTGTGLVIAGVVLLVAVPLVALLPGWGGAGVWLAIAGLGAVAVVSATLLERGRSAVSGWWHRLGEAEERIG